MEKSQIPINFWTDAFENLLNYCYLNLKDRFISNSRFYSPTPQKIREAPKRKLSILREPLREKAAKNNLKF